MGKHFTPISLGGSYCDDITRDVSLCFEGGRNIVEVVNQFRIILFFLVLSTCHF